MGPVATALNFLLRARHLLELLGFGPCISYSQNAYDFRICVDDANRGAVRCIGGETCLLETNAQVECCSVGIWIALDVYQVLLCL
jgi:hypothetical protein